MAFDINAFDNVTSGSSLGPRIWSYGSSTDDLATMTASGYFDDVKFRINFHDLIYVSASDGVEQLIVTSQNGAVATTETYVPSSGGAPSSASYIVQTPHPDLPNEVALSTLINVTAQPDDILLILDASDSDNPKSVTAQSIADLASGGAGVVLPTIANHLAYFTDVDGTISSGASSAIHNGSIQSYGNLISGKNDGTLQGGLQLYPPGASSGYFLIQALNAGGNFTTTLYTNPSQSGNKSFLFPNAVTNSELYLAAYDGALAPAAGNIAVYGNNLGLLVDGGATLGVTKGGTGLATMTTAYAPVCAGTTATGNLQVASTGLSTSGFVLTSNGSSAVPSFQAVPAPSVSFLTVSVPLTSNDIKTMYTTPVELIAAPGSGNMITIYSCFMNFTYSTAAYTGGGTVKIQYGTTSGGGGASTLSTLTAGTMGVTSNYIMYMSVSASNSLLTDFVNKSICISNLTGVFASGSGTAVITIVYRIVVP